MKVSPQSVWPHDQQDAPVIIYCGEHDDRRMVMLFMKWQNLESAAGSTKMHEIVVCLVRTASMFQSKTRTQVHKFYNVHHMLPVPRDSPNVCCLVSSVPGSAMRQFQRARCLSMMFKAFNLFVWAPATHLLPFRAGNDPVAVPAKSAPGHIR